MYADKIVSGLVKLELVIEATAITTLQTRFVMLSKISNVSQ